MSRFKEEMIRQRIGNFMELNPILEMKDVVKHFELEGIIGRTVRNIYHRFKNGQSAQRKEGSGQYQSVPNAKQKKIVKDVVNKIGLSYRLVGRKFNVDHKTVKKILDINGIKRTNRKKIPKSTEKQMKTQKMRLNRVRKTFLAPKNGLDVIEDDEAYFTIDGSDYKKNDFYYAHPSISSPKNVATKPIPKFAEKVMVWIAMSPKGFSQSVITKSRNAVTKETYIKDCLPKVKNLIEKHYSDGNYIFWPDLASSHYAKLTLEVMNRLNIKFIPKDSNPPNVPQLRAIERFWAILKERMYANGWATEDIQELIKRIKWCIKRMPKNISQNLLRDTKTKVRKAADKGVLSVIT